MRHWGRLILLAAAVLAAGLSGCGKKTAPQSPRGRLKVTMPVPAAELFINGKSLGKGSAAFSLAPGDYLLKTVAPGCVPEWRQVRIETGREVRVAPQPARQTASLLIVSTPEGARVTIDSEFKGETPLVLPGLPLGGYRIRVEKTNVSPRVVDCHLTDERPRKVEVALTSNVGLLRVETTPKNGRLLLNGKVIGETPIRTELEAGSYRLELHYAGYRSRRDTVQIERGRELKYKHRFELLPGAVQVQSDPPGATVRLNGKGVGVTPLTVPELPVGDYRVEVVKAGFLPASRSVEVVSGSTAQVDMALERNSGGIDLVVNPPGASIYLNGRKIGVSRVGENEFSGKLLELRNLSPGTYEIVAAHKRADPERVRIRVKVTKGAVARPEPIELWVKNAEIKQREDGQVITGVLRAESDSTIRFSPHPGVTQTYKRSELEYVRRLKNEE